MTIDRPPGGLRVRTVFLSELHLGTRVVFVPGNHDERLREFCGQTFGAIEVLRECVHVTEDGRRLLVLHGDAFDAVMKCGRFMSTLGTQLYDLFLRWGYRLNRARRLFGLGHWSLVTWLKGRMGNVRRHVERFEQVAAIEAQRRGLDGVVCGHIHRPSVARIEGVLYCNDGDWVEHCTALVESHLGEMQLWNWPERPIHDARRASALPEAA